MKSVAKTSDSEGTAASRLPQHLLRRQPVADPVTLILFAKIDAITRRFKRQSRPSCPQVKVHTRVLGMDRWPTEEEGALRHLIGAKEVNFGATHVTPIAMVVVGLTSRCLRILRLQLCHALLGKRLCLFCIHMYGNEEA